MSFLLFNGLLLLIIVFLLLILSMVWPPDSPWSPWWRTTKKTAEAACKLGHITQKDIVYELGCGDGQFLLTSVKQFGAKGVGIEIDMLRAFIARFLIKLNGVSQRTTVIRGNFFEQDLSEATVIFVYLVPKALNKLKSKFLKELKPGTRIISLRYQMSLPCKKRDTLHSLFLYAV